MLVVYKQATETAEEKRLRDNERVRQYRLNNPDKVRASKQKYYSSEKGKACKRREEERYVASGKRAESELRRALKPLTEARRAARVKWAKSDAGRAWQANNRAVRRSMTKGLTDDEQFILLEAYNLAKLREKLLGTKWHVDHIKPISLGGKSSPDNIQVVPASWNRKKSNKHTEKFFGAN